MVDAVEPAPPMRMKRLVASAVGAALAAYLVTLAANRSLVRVQGPSMEPLLWPGDRLVTVPVHRWWLRPGQIVVVVAPDDESRSRARPVGDRPRNGRLVDGRLVVKRLVDLTDGTVDVRGDATDRSTDSRTWGRLPVRHVRRVALCRWPDVRTRLRRRIPPPTARS